MNPLMKKQELDSQINKSDFLNDIDCLFEVLHTSYGLYEYFGHDAFTAAKAEISSKLNDSSYEFHHAVSIVKNAFSSFIKDGHFGIGLGSTESHDPGFAVRHTFFQDTPMIQCRKFYFDSPEEEKELIQFSESYVQYQNDAPLIIDVRDNPGGSDIYIWDFIKGLYGVEPDYPCKYVQKYSVLFREAARTEKQGLEIFESDGVRIRSKKPIFIWINENTASSAESAVAYFRTAENVVVVGTHTAGCFSCGNCMTIYLPNSHLPVYFGTGMVLYEKIRNIDAEGGFQADISNEEFLEMFGKSEENEECPSFQNKLTSASPPTSGS